MPRTMTEALETLIDVVDAKKPLGEDAPEGSWTRSALHGAAAMYANKNDRLNIDFTVGRLAFPEIQAMNPRLLRRRSVATVMSMRST